MEHSYTIGDFVRSGNLATLDSLIPLKEAFEKYREAGGYLSDVSYEDVTQNYPFLDGEPIYCPPNNSPYFYYFNERDLFPMTVLFNSTKSDKKLKIYGDGRNLTAKSYSLLKGKNRGLFDKAPLKVISKITDDSLAVSFFCNNIDRIPKQQLFSVFTRFYPMIDYGFSLISPDIWDKILSSRTKQAIERIEAEASLPTSFPIYRGEEDKSNPAGYSYTTDFSTAVFFASRFTGAGKITCGIVRHKDILWHYNGRSESEVWVRPEDVEKTFEIVIYSSKEVFSDLPKEKYQYFRALLATLDYIGFAGTDKLRNLRVLFLGLIMASREFSEIARSEIALNSLAAALAFHNCEETSEIYDVLLTETNPRWVKFLMESFCLPDEEKREEKEELLSSGDKQMLRNMLGILEDAIYLESECANGKMKFELDKFRLNNSAKYISVAKDACRFLKL